MSRQLVSILFGKRISNFSRHHINSTRHHYTVQNQQFYSTSQYRISNSTRCTRLQNHRAYILKTYLAELRQYFLDTFANAQRQRHCQSLLIYSCSYSTNRMKKYKRHNEKMSRCREHELSRQSCAIQNCAHIAYIGSQNFTASKTTITKRNINSKAHSITCSFS